MKSKSALSNWVVALGHWLHSAIRAEPKNYSPLSCWMEELQDSSLLAAFCCGGRDLTPPCEQLQLLALFRKGYEDDC